MGQTGFFHHIGSLLLFAATILLVITDISSPVVNDIALLKVDLTNATSTHNSAVTFGTFGYCVINTPGASDDDNVDYCSGTHIGYDPAAVLAATEGTSFSDATTNTGKALTRVMVLHPVATGVAFLAFLLAVGAGVIGSFLGSLVALLAFAVTLVVLITDFVMFALLKNKINGATDASVTTSLSSGDGDVAKFGPAIWTLLAAAVCLLLGTIVVFFTCCSTRFHSRSAAPRKVDLGYAGDRRRRFGFNS